MINFIIGVILKSLFLILMLASTISQYNVDNESSAWFAILSIVCGFILIEHLCNPKDDFGDDRII